jgi:hypothetical protein
VHFTGQFLLVTFLHLSLSTNVLVLMRVLSLSLSLPKVSMILVQVLTIVNVEQRNYNRLTLVAQNSPLAWKLNFEFLSLPFFIRNRATGLVMDVYYKHREPGTPVILFRQKLNPLLYVLFSHHSLISFSLLFSLVSKFSISLQSSFHE